MNLNEMGNIFILHKNKVPYSALTQKRANIKDKKNLCSYEMAHNVYKNNPQFDGIGIVLGDTINGHLCGLDIDNCINDNGEISENAQEIINILDTYSEISISGKGIHILFFATKKGNNCKNNSLKWCKCLEIYDKNRYFTISENKINDKEILYRQKQCNLIYDKYFNGEFKESYLKNKIINLNTSEYDIYNINDYLSVIDKAILKDIKLFNYWHRNKLNDDESRNDLGLFQKLAHYTNCKPLIMFNLALLSPYFAQKDFKHKNKWLRRKDYLKRTILRAIENYRGYLNEN